MSVRQLRLSDFARSYTEIQMHGLSTTSHWPMRGSAARAIAQILWAGLRTDIFHMAQDAIAAGLASEEGRLDGEFDAFERAGCGGVFIN